MLTSLVVSGAGGGVLGEPKKGLQTPGSWLDVQLDTFVNQIKNMEQKLLEELILFYCHCSVWGTASF